MLARAMGVLKLAAVALDSSKVHANASRHGAATTPIAAIAARSSRSGHDLRRRTSEDALSAT
jgi:hypothetical protein